MRIEGRTGVARYADDIEGPPRVGSQGEMIVSDMNGLYYEQTMRGNAFVYSSSAAVSVVALGTAGAPNLWNPAGSGKNLVITRIVMGAAAVGTPVVSAFTYGVLNNAGVSIGTGAPVISLTQVAGVNLLFGSGNVSSMRFAPATISLTAAPTFLCPAGFTSGSAVTPNSVSLIDDVSGRIIISPGNLFQIGASTATSTTYFIAIYGLELTIPMTA